MTDLSKLIKPLVWDGDGEARGAGDWYSISPVAPFVVWVNGYVLGGTMSGVHQRTFDTIEAARAAAQAEHDKRALDPLDTEALATMFRQSSDLLTENAATIERLSAENARLRGYVRQVAETEWQEDEPDDGWWCEDIGKPYVAEMEHHCNWTVDHAKALLKDMEADDA